MGFWIFGKKDNEIKKLKDNLKDSFSNIKEDIKNVHGILDHFKEKHNHNDKKHDMHSGRFEKLEEDIYRIYEILENLDRRKVEHSIVHERSRTFNRSNQSFMNVQTIKNLKEILTPAQKRVIQLLMIAETPMEYDDLAKELGLNIVTIRRHINDIKKMGFKVREKMNVEHKRKVFYLEKEMKQAIKRKK